MTLPSEKGATYKGASPLRKRPPSQDPPRTLGRGLGLGRFSVREEPLYGPEITSQTQMTQVRAPARPYSQTDMPLPSEKGATYKGASPLRKRPPSQDPPRTAEA